MAIDKEVHAVVRTKTSGRTIAFRVILVLVLIAAASGGYAFWKNSQRFESTDDAQVDGQIYSISSRISRSLSATDTAYSKGCDVSSANR